MSDVFRKTTRDLKAGFLYRLYPKLIDSITSVAVRGAARRLKAQNTPRLLIDNTVLAHGVTHETGWIGTGKKLWGTLDVEAGYLARIPVHAESDNSEAARSIKYLPGIGHLARRGVIILAISSELRDEQWAQPAGRFWGYGLYDFSMFNDLNIEIIDDPDYTVAVGAQLGFPSIKEQRKERLHSKADPLFRQLVSVLGSKNSQDAWHIVTAERNNCYCFLTMDFKLIRNVRAQAGNVSIKSLKTKIITPEEFGKEFKIIPIPPRLYSYHNASYPVLSKANWPDSKRQKMRKKKDK